MATHTRRRSVTSSTASTRSGSVWRHSAQVERTQASHKRRQILATLLYAIWLQDRLSRVSSLEIPYALGALVPNQARCLWLCPSLNLARPSSSSRGLPPGGPRQLLRTFLGHTLGFGRETSHPQNKSSGAPPAPPQLRLFYRYPLRIVAKSCLWLGRTYLSPWAPCFSCPALLSLASPPWR